MSHSTFERLSAGEPISAQRSLSVETSHPSNEAFLERLASLEGVSGEHSTPLKWSPSRLPSKWLYVPYDQLSFELSPLDEGPEVWGLILLESGAWDRLRPYHKQRLGALTLNQRAFALEAAEQVIGG